ncbi:hypothetical protein NP233_g12194 [Leucocoprinus birnbaumii]|uniref:Uncharacterized protein n=1 Tax=Leucocoprinus birnbaumii TaxID=56174 RepID=A0AAD5VKK8_9AGAR|nr:hypothetical protein NP233_g12194 [Leucocoprinus birnbaumii]
MAISPPLYQCIPANPDISGLGVRIAIYVQNILSLIPAIAALHDKKVTLAELELLQKQFITILLTAFAILIATIVQALTSSVTSYHATIVLNLSWMNNTNTFIYLLLYAHHKHHQFMHSGQTEVSFVRYWWRNVREGWRKEIEESGEVVISGSLHLTIMAAVGIWLWSQPASFGIGGTCSMDASVFFANVRSSSVSYRAWSLFIYSLLLLPGLNLIIPVCFFLLLFHAFSQFVHLFHQASTSNNPTTTITTSSILLGLACIFAIDIFFLTLTESQIKLNANLLNSGDSVWTFGQILALLLLLIPLRELLETILERNSKKLGEILLSLCRSDDHLVAEYLVQLGAPVDYKGKNEESRETVAMFAAKQRRFKMTKALLESGADISVFDENGLHRVANAIQKLDANATDVILQQRTKPLHVAAELGVVEVVRQLLVKTKDRHIDATDSHGKQPIHHAAHWGHACVVELLASKGANIEAQDRKKWTPMHHAASKGHAVVVEYLISKGANIEAEDGKRWTPIHRASFGGHLDVVKSLVLKNAKIEVQDNNEWTPMHHAAYKGHAVIVEFLTSKGANIEAQDAKKHTPIHRAASGGQLDVVKLLVLNSAKIEAPDNKEWTPMHHAASKGHADVVEFLISKGANMEAEDEDKWTPIHQAAFGGHLEVVEFLISKGANIITQDAKKHTPIHVAAFEGQLAMVKLLNLKNANIETLDNDGWSPMHHAAHKGHAVIVEFLISKGTNIDIQDNDGCTPMHHAIFNGHADVVELLISKGANIEARDKEDWTPMHHAASNGPADVTELLISKGANIEAQDKEEWTPLHHAAYKGHADVVEFLISKGANIEAEDENKWTPIHRAAFRGHYDVVNFLLMRDANIEALVTDGPQCIMQYLMDMGLG